MTLVTQARREQVMCKKMQVLAVLYSIQACCKLGLKVV